MRASEKVVGKNQMLEQCGIHDNVINKILSAKIKDLLMVPIASRCMRKRTYIISFTLSKKPRLAGWLTALYNSREK